MATLTRCLDDICPRRVHCKRFVLPEKPGEATTSAESFRMSEGGCWEYVPASVDEMLEYTTRDANAVPVVESLLASMPAAAPQLARIHAASLRGSVAWLLTRAYVAPAEDRTVLPNGRGAPHQKRRSALGYSRGKR